MTTLVKRKLNKQHLAPDLYSLPVIQPDSPAIESDQPTNLGSHPAGWQPRLLLTKVVIKLYQ